MTAPLIPFTLRDNLDDSRPWGGEYIAGLKGLPPVPGRKIGESWEISVNASRPGVVADGPFQGLPLSGAVARDPAGILGAGVANRYGGVFPVLLKILDAADNLSVQVHPPTEYARRRHGDAFGKEEAWFVLPGSEGGALYLGLAEGRTLAEFEAVVRSGRDFALADYMNEVPVTPGETYFIRCGTLHALGRGVKVAEIQRDSDRTYRVYDYNRKDKDGKPRGLHVDDGFAVIDGSLSGAACVASLKTAPRALGPGDLLHLPPEAAHFQLRTISLAAGRPARVAATGSFLTVTAFAALEIRHAAGTLRLGRGRSALVPAACGDVALAGPEGALAIVTWVPG